MSGILGSGLILTGGVEVFKGKVGEKTTWCHPFNHFKRTLRRDPVEMTLQKFADGGEAAELEGSKGGLYQGITVEELSAKWQETTVELAKRDITVTHAQHALEGALLIRYSTPKRPLVVGKIMPKIVVACAR